jgi:hypothetical protein
MKKNTSAKTSKGAIVAIGAGVAALAAASYYFFGPEGQKHRKMAKGWMLKMKAEVIEKIENAKEMTQSTYDTIVDTVAKKYAKNPEIGIMVDMLKKQWKGISGGTKKSVKKVAKKAVKKAVKK